MTNFKKEIKKTFKNIDWKSFILGLYSWVFIEGFFEVLKVLLK